MTVLNALGLAIIIALLLADFLVHRLIIRALVGLIDRLPPYRPSGRYRSRSEPEKYASFRKPRNVR